MLGRHAEPWQQPGGFGTRHGKRFVTPQQSYPSSMHLISGAIARAWAPVQIVCMHIYTVQYDRCIPYGTGYVSAGSHFLSTKLPSYRLLFRIRSITVHGTRVATFTVYVHAW